MNICMLKSKIHRAVVVQAQLQYVGSITIDEALMKLPEFMSMKKCRLQMLKMENVSKHM